MRVDRANRPLLVWLMAVYTTLPDGVAAQTATESVNLLSSASSTVSYSQSTSTGTTTTSSTREPVTRTVSVGYAGHTFKPEVTLAEVGDTIEFNFFPTNHSVVRSPFGYPCVPYEMTGSDKLGFFSGFKAVDAILPDPPKFSILVNDTEPVFFYCSAPGSCLDYGMVGAINPNATQTVARQKQLAKEADFMLQPGEPWPAESTPDPFTTSTPSATSTSESSTSVPTSPSIVHHHSGLSGGAIAGIVIGSVAGLLIIGVLFYLCGRNRALAARLSKHRSDNHDAFLDQRQSVMSGTTAYTADPKHPPSFIGYARPNSDAGFQPPSHHGSPGLPQYASLHHDPRSPSLHEDHSAFSPGAQSEYGPRSPSPGKAPGYNGIPQQLPQANQGPHEMP